MPASSLRSGRRTIRFWLIVLAVACVLPAMVTLIFFMERSYRYARANLERDTIATARALTQAVDLELSGIVSSLQVLATSTELAASDFASFYQQAVQALHFTPANNVVLSDASGQQILNTLVPLGSPLPKHGNLEQLRRVLESGTPLISDLYIGGVLQRLLIGIEVPVFSNGRPVYGLAMEVLPEGLGQILRRQNIPSGWVAGILDRESVIVVRTAGTNEFVGRKASPSLLKSMAEGHEGMMQGATLEGMPVFGSFSRSPLSGWTVAIAIPKIGLIGQWEYSIWLYALGVALLFALATVLAVAIGRRISQSIEALEAPAMALGSTAPLAVPALKIEESHGLGEALKRARELIEQRSSERDEALARECKSRTEFQVLFESAPNGVILIDGDGLISLLNAEAERLFGYSRSELLGACVDILLPKQARTAQAKFRSSFMHASEMGAGRELFARRKDGTEFPVEIGLNPIRTGEKDSVMITVVDISLRRLAEQKLSASLRERDDLRRRVMQAQEQERLRLAHDLHDQTGQSLTAAMLELKGVESLVDGTSRERLHLLRKQMEEMGKTLHRVAWELRPASIDELGLGNTLANYISEWSNQYGITADFHCADVRLDELPEEVRTTIYRVVQEALSNVAKHAGNSNFVSIVIKRVGGGLRLMIEDDGSGFRTNAAREEGDRNGGLGLAGMRERLALIGGDLEVESAPGAGTTIFAFFPTSVQRKTA